MANRIVWLTFALVFVGSLQALATALHYIDWSLETLAVAKIGTTVPVDWAWKPSAHASVWAALLTTRSTLKSCWHSCAMPASKC
jgi:hypothetical protein